MLDVVSNNLANLNTTAFKAGRTVFSDLLYTTIRPATNSTDADIGGTNPNQIGSGVKSAQISKRLSQGNLDLTGEMFDFALQGDGFFVLNDGNTNLYSRAGSFALDSSGYLVDPSTGYRVQRFGSLGESDEPGAGFQSVGDTSISIPFGAFIPGESTTEIKVSGNLSANLLGPATEVLTASTPFTVGGVAATGATFLNDLDSNETDYVLGDQITLNGTDVDGTDVSFALAVDGATTVGQLVSAIDAQYVGATASLDTDGNLVLRADSEGEALLSLVITDDPSNTGRTGFLGHRMSTTTAGKEGDIFETSVEVFDVRGGAHKILLTFQKRDDSTWDMTASPQSSGDTVVDNAVSNIRFFEDGRFDQVVGTGVGDPNITFRFEGFADEQFVDISFDNFTQLATYSALATDQDGYASGTLSSVNVTSDGVLDGVATKLTSTLSSPQDSSEMPPSPPSANRMVAVEPEGVKSRLMSR
jgi:flagellar hook protein FlgE